MPYFPPSSAVIGASNANDLISNNYRLFDNALQTAVNNAGMAWRQHQQNVYNTVREQQLMRLGVLPSGNYQKDWPPAIPGNQYMEQYLKGLGQQGDEVVRSPWSFLPGIVNNNGTYNPATEPRVPFRRE